MTKTKVKEKEEFNVIDVTLSLFIMVLIMALIWFGMIKTSISSLNEMCSENYKNNIQLSGPFDNCLPYYYKKAEQSGNYDHFVKLLFPTKENK